MKAHVFTVVLATLLLNACSKNKEMVELSPEEIKAIKTEIQELENNYAKAVNEHNVDSIMNYYADDAKSYDYQQHPLNGKDEIRENLLEESTDFSKSSKISYTVKDVLTSDGFQVVEVGRYEIHDSAGIVFGTGTYFSVFEKRDGKYLCIRDIQTPDMPEKKGRH